MQLKRKGTYLTRNIHEIFLLFIITAIIGCGGIPMAGLNPDYPPVEKKAFAAFTDFVEVDSLQPTFRWQPFPRAEDHFADKVQDVFYELRIWTMPSGEPCKLRYVRNDLKLPYHKLEEPLEPSTKYLWSVRALFMINGQLRVTEWGLAGIPLRNEAVPNISCFRFKTLEKH